MKLHLEGKTEQARADLARLAIIKKQREEAAKKRDELRKGEIVKIVQCGESIYLAAHLNSCFKKYVVSENVHECTEPQIYPRFISNYISVTSLKVCR